MTIYEKNTEYLKIHRKQLYNRIEEYSNSQDCCIDIIDSGEAKDGTKILIAESYGIVYRLNSNYNPNKEAERWAQQFDFNNINCVVSFFGLGNGIFVRSLIKRINKRDTIVIYEPCMEIFLYVLKEFDISDIIENENICFILKGINDTEFRSTLNKIIDWNNLGSHKFCSHPFYEELFIYDYKKFLNEIKENSTLTYINRNTVALMGKASVKNTVHNLKFIKDSNIVSDLCDVISEDIPAIIVAAGPSLEKNIKDLKKAKNKSIIIATDRALDFLLDCDIEPDFVVTLDPIKPVTYFSKRDNIEIPLLCKIESNPEILDIHKGKKIWFDSHEFLTKIYNKFNKKFTITNSGGSVATGAFSICIELKLKNIILIGQDLAYSGNFTHAGGVLNSGINENSVIEYVEDIYGNMIPTRYDWKFFKLWFEDAIQSYPEVNVIDATEGGAKIEGTKIMTLNEAIEECCTSEINCMDIMNNIPNTLNKQEYEYVKEYVNQAMNDLDIISSNLKEVIKICTKLIDNAEKNKPSTDNDKLIKKLSSRNSRIIEKPIYTLIDLYISDTSVNYLPFVNTCSGKAEDDQKNTLLLSLRIYRDMEVATKEIKGFLDDVINTFK